MERVGKNGNLWIKALILILCLALIMTAAAVWSVHESADADVTPTQKLTVSNATVHRGQEFDITISLSGNTSGFLAMRLLITYDTSAMTLVGYKVTGLSAAWASNFMAANTDVYGGYSTYGTEDKPFVLMWAHSSKLTGNGTFATLTFASKPQATPTQDTLDQKPYVVKVETDERNTLLPGSVNATFDVEEGGGQVTMLKGLYGVTLLNAYGDTYIEYENNQRVATIQDALDEMGGVLPPKQATAQYTYNFLSWREHNSPDEDHLVFMPTYRAVPVSYDVSFHLGIKKEGSDTIVTDVNDADLQALLGGDYLYDTDSVSIPYGTIIVFEDYVPNADQDYTFLGWFTDPDFQNPVDYVTMRAQNVDLYGYYAFNADAEDHITTKLEMKTAVDGEYLIATLSVKENFGFNSIRFALDYDHDVLEFLGFYYPTDTELYGELVPTFPVINDEIAAENNVDGTWQYVGDGYSIADKHFFFINVSSNAYSSSAVSATGDLISFKFAVKQEVPSTEKTEIGVSIGNRNLTRYVGDGSIHYANAIVAPSATRIIRVAKPTKTEITYTYNGSEQSYTFASAGDAAYYDVENLTRTAAGEYVNGDAVKVSLRTIANTFLTWADGSQSDLSFNFIINKLGITKPGETKKTYTYTGNDQKYLFSSEEELDYYTIAKNYRKDAGVYTGENAVKVSLKDTDNTEWADGTSATLSYVFTIDKKKIAMPTETTETYTYDDGNDIPYVFASAGDSTGYTLANAVRTNAGTYKDANAVKATLKDTANTEWTDGTTDPLTFTFTIAKKKIAMPTETTETYTYDDGNDISYKFASVGDSAGYTVLNGVRKNAGTYTGEDAVKAALKDTANTEWTDGTSDALSFDFVIAKKLLPSPIVNPKSYTGFNQTATVILSGSEPYEVTENEGGVAYGNYDVKFTFKTGNFANYGWQDSLTDTVTVIFRIMDIQNTWEITPYVVPEKLYDGTAITTSDARATFGDVVITYRLQSGTDADYSATAPKDAGSYFVRFFVQETSSYNGLIEELPFKINKVELTEPTQTVKTYTYTGAPQNYEFANAGDTEQYTVVGGTRTDAGSQPLTVSIRDAKNYVWKGGSSADISFTFTIEKAKVAMPTEGTKSYVYTGSEQSYEFAELGDALQYNVTGATRTDAGDYTVTAELKDSANYIWSDNTSAALEFPFAIERKRLVIPTAADKIYVANGNEQTFAFENAGDTDQYFVTNNKRTVAGKQTVEVSLKNSSNYVWEDGTVEVKTYTFEVYRPEITAQTAADGYTVKISEYRGFSVSDTFSVALSQVDHAELIAAIAQKDKKGALNRLTNEEAAELVAGKCVMASIVTTYRSNVSVSSGEYTYTVTLPQGQTRTGLVAIRFVGFDVEVFRTTAIGENGLSFVSDEIGNFMILADHVFDKTVASAAYLKSEPTCEEKAVYYKSCECGISSEGFTGETFVYGDPLGHDYDVDHIEWIWNEKHTAATAKIVCLNDQAHVLVFEAQVTVSGLAPKVDESGYVEYTATIEYEGEEYSDSFREILPANGHEYHTDPVWDWIEGKDNYLAKAYFTCDCGESVQVEDATVTYVLKETTIEFTALVVFNGETFTDKKVIDIPVVAFNFNDGVTEQRSEKMLPGQKIIFIDAPARAHYVFVGWRDESGTLILKTEAGYMDYYIGFERIEFTAEWRNTAESVSIRVVDSVTQEPIQNATVTLYEGDAVTPYSETTGETGAILFENVPYGNYKIVAEYPYMENVIVTRTDSLDVDENEIALTLTLPRNQFNTKVVGDGSSEGLEGAISQEEREAINEGTEGGTINSIVITQKRLQNVSDAIKAEMNARLRRDDLTGRSKFTDFYDVTIEKVTTARNSSGVLYTIKEMIKVADQFQVNVFPIKYELRATLASFGASAQNIFVYKRHTYDTGTVVIYPLPKVESEEAARRANYECYFIKVVAGEEFIAVYQKEYSELGFGASPEPILLANEITSLTIADWTYGDTPSTPFVRAVHGENIVRYTYSTEEYGDYTSVKPTSAGRYYLKATIPADGGYEGVEKVISFTIAKKKIGDIQGLEFKNKSFWFNGKRHSIYVSGDLPDGVQVTYSGNREWDLGRFVVTAYFTVSNENYDVSEPMTAVMSIRLNWIPILILIVIVLVILILVIVIVEKLLKKVKKNDNPPPDENGSDDQKDGAEEGSSND